MVLGCSQGQSIHSYLLSLLSRCLLKYSGHTDSKQKKDQRNTVVNSLFHTVMGDDRQARLKALAARAGRTKEATPTASSGDEGRGATPAATTTSRPGDGEESAQKSISFRNYAPQDRSLEQPGGSEEGDTADPASARTTPPPTHTSRPPPSKRQRVAGGEGAAVATSPTGPAGSSSGSALQHALAKTRQEAANAGGGGGKARGKAAATSGPTTAVAHLAPKKVNWDLKRDIADRLARLERRTQKAIVEMLRERLELEAAKEVNNDEDDDDDSDLD